ncbi:MAG: hypothetical protein QM608_09690 [Caulobacter sp.]
MTDGFTLRIDGELADHVTLAAAEAGVSREAYAHAVLAQDAKGGAAWVVARARAADLDCGGETLSLAEAFDLLDATLVRRRARLV